MDARGGYLLLEDGTRFDGRLCGAEGRALGEVVFTTGMSGYQESMSDPSFAGQLITFTYPHIGNYGASAEAMESERVWARAAIMREACNREDAPTAERGWLDWLADCGVPAISELDTRSLVQHIRRAGAMRGGLFADSTPEGRARELIAAEPEMAGQALASTVTPSEVSRHGEQGGAPHPAVLDTGVKASMVRSWWRAARVSAACSAPRKAARRGPDAVFLANGQATQPRFRRSSRPCAAGRRQAGVGHLPRPPAAVPGGRAGDVQAAVRPPRRQPPGARPHTGRVRSPPRTTAAPHSTGRGAHDRRGGGGALGHHRRRLTRVNLYDLWSRASSFSRSPESAVSITPRRAQPPPSLYLFDRTSSASASPATVPANPMPRRNDIHKILLLGSGPIVIGQAAEFDYSGVQACKVLREEGYEVVLVNSNPATIMTDPDLADATYIEPLLPAAIAKVIERECPDALLGTLGGQTALNLSKALHDDGTLERFGVELIGATSEALACAEDRELFGRAMARRGKRRTADRDQPAGARGRCRGWAAVHRAPGLHARRARRGSRAAGGVRRIVSLRLEVSPIGRCCSTSRSRWGEFELG
jgi:hypothetical protein